MGALPNTEWLADSGLQLNPGLECDATLTAVGDPDILGAGDIVSWPHPLADGDAIRIEHWTVAAEQGQQAGRNVLAGTRMSASPTTSRRTSGQTSTTRRSSRSACPAERSVSSSSRRPRTGRGSSTAASATGGWSA